MIDTIRLFRLLVSVLTSQESKLISEKIQTTHLIFIDNTGGATLCSIYVRGAAYCSERCCRCVRIGAHKILNCLHIHLTTKVVIVVIINSLPLN